MTKNIAAIASLGVMGCSPFSSLPDEVYDHVARQMKYSEAEAQVVDELARTTKKDAVFSAAQENSVEAFLEDHAQTQADLAYYFSHDQIIGFYEDEYPKWEGNAAFYRDNWFRGDDFIAINLDRYEDIDPSVLMHEAGHILREGHSSALDESYDGIFDANFAEVVIENRDYPYLLTLLYLGAEKALEDPHDYGTRVVQSYHADVLNNTLTPQEAYTDLTLLIQKSKEEWIQESLESAYPSIVYTDTFEWTEEEFADALKNSGMFEYRQDVLKEYVCNFAKEYPEIEVKEC